ncbi:dUTP diphosphatase [Rhodobacter capsulatus]|uniref:dUTP diphosphatase n=1 Tax=Rhodobacter capsulatus TaxID=1061 RepID=UPI0040256537
MTPIIKVLREAWADPAVALPSYETQGAAGADIRANLPPEIREAGLVLAPMGRAIVPTGLRVEIPEGFEMQIRPRSGLAFKHGLGMPNGPGTIDSDYRGPLGVLMINFGAEAYTITHGERVAQAIVAPVVQARYEIVADLGETDRGAGGFGSTGKG